VLRHDGVWRAKRNLSVRFLRACRRAARCQRDVATRGIRAAWCVAVVSMTPAQYRHPSQMTVNPVRQCARPRAFAHGVAQASPLFSDHAPREVHLWQ
jgi:hypothetical protein